ncbi:MAG TPA: ADOP family duplicated permease [Bryobacteraceae bacterium]|jgi:predicted permease|nr:ADOP family duplicated permease [Bryobacteraceae bacterium]
MKGLRFFWRRSDTDRLLEMQAHRQMAEDDYLERGVTPEQARRRAAAEAGSSTAVLETVREQDFLGRLELVLRDFVAAGRSLRRTPVFFVTAALTLALGIGVNTAIFSFLYGLVLKSLPTDEPRQLTLLGFASRSDSSGFKYTNLTYPMFRAAQQELHSFSGIAAWTADYVTLRDSEGALRPYTCAYVSGNAFEVLPVNPYMGRMLARYDDVRNGPAQGWPVVLGYGFWADRYGADRSILGKQIRIFDVPVTVVGVAPKGFKGPWAGTDVKMYLPMFFGPAALKRDYLTAPDSMWPVEVLGRLREGIGVGEARAELDGMRRSFLNRFLPMSARRNGYEQDSYVRVETARSGFPSYVTRTYARPLMLMQGLVGVVLLLCCVNVGGLMMSKVHMRRREFAVRAALGGPVLRLIRLYLIESLMLASAGSIIGAFLAWHGSAWLLHFFRDPMMGEPMEVKPDTTMLYFAAGLTVLTTLAFGVVPAWRAAHADPGDLLKSRTSLGGSRRIAGRAFVPVQVAISLVLATLAALLSESILSVRSGKTGFDVDHVTIQNSPLFMLHTEGEQHLRLYQRMLERLQQMPGVRGAAAASRTPLTGEPVNSRFEPVREGESANQMDLAFDDVTPGYFQAMHVALTAGRDFTWSDKSLNVCVLNTSAAQLMFPHQEALNRYVRTRDEQRFPGGATCRVVGIAENAKFSDVRQGPPPTIYFPVSLERIDKRIGNLVFLINSNTKKIAIDGFRSTLAEIAPTLPLVTFVTLREQMDAALGSEELITLLSNFFGATALILSALGLYGLMSASVTQRTGEIGLRMALGANRNLVIYMVLSEAVRLLLAGLASGALLLFFAVQLAKSELSDIFRFDPATAGLVIVVLLAVTLAASLAPALRAAKVDPIYALRAD